MKKSKTLTLNNWVLAGLSKRKTAPYWAPPSKSQGWHQIPWMTGRARYPNIAKRVLQPGFGALYQQVNTRGYAQHDDLNAHHKAAIWEPAAMRTGTLMGGLSLRICHNFALICRLRGAWLFLFCRKNPRFWANLLPSNIQLSYSNRQIFDGCGF